MPTYVYHTHIHKHSTLLSPALDAERTRDNGNENAQQSVKFHQKKPSLLTITTAPS